MKKTILSLCILTLWVTPGASPAAAQEAAEVQGQFEGRAAAGYHSVTRDGSARAGEYDYLKPSGSGALDLEWDPLPHRFVLESYFLNPEDFFGAFDYAYRDIVLFNGYTRSMYHNLDHVTFGPDDPATLSPSSSDRDPGADYAVQNLLHRAFIRFKTPDFPLHLYADLLAVDREGTRQQRFMRGFTGGLDRASESREIDWHTREVRVGTNSHLGPLEADYHHSEKAFTARKDDALFDAYAAPAMTIPHNLIPNLRSSSDTVKVHTIYSGRFTASGTYTEGEKKNNDSKAGIDYRNAAGDVTFMPVTGLMLVAKYRHYGLSANNPDRVTLPGLGATYAVLDALSSKRDLITGVVRYRLTTRLTVRGEYVFDTVSRSTGPGGVITPLQLSPVPSGSAPGFWEVSSRTTKGTVKLGADYRLMRKLTLRADARYAEVTNPAYAADPDRIGAGNASFTWLPFPRVTALASYGGVRERRENLSAPLAGGSRSSDRDQAVGSLTVPVGNRSSVTASYLYFKYKAAETVTWQDGSGLFIRESGVPYADTAEVGALSATCAVSEAVFLTADASRSFSKGRFRNSGSVAGTGGIAGFSDLRVVEDFHALGVEVRFSPNVGGDLRYQQRRYDDRIDGTEDGKVSATLATLSMKW